MGYPVDLGNTVQALVFGPVVQSGDHNSPAIGLSPTVTISKNGGAFAPPAGAVSEVGNGWYKVAANATDANTLGPIALHVAAAAGNDPFDDVFPVVGYNPQSSTLGMPQDGSGVLQVDVSRWNSALTGNLPSNFPLLSIDAQGRVTTSNPAIIGGGGCGTGGGPQGTSPVLVFPSNSTQTVGTLYCSRTDIDEILSTFGTDSAATDDDAQSSLDHINSCIARASQRLDFKLNNRYDQGQLFGHRWVTQATAVLASVYLMRRRGNPPPESLLEMQQEVNDDIEEINSYKKSLNGLAERYLRQPTMSNISIDRRYFSTKVRADVQLSTGMLNSQLVRYTSIDLWLNYW